MTANELMQRFSMKAHPENGSFIEKHYANDYAYRAASGSIYYYVAAGERTEFHRIDCDEYWCYAAGSPLELWMIDECGAVSINRLGTEVGCEPMVYIRRGMIFASRNLRKDGDGTFLTCITVPRFSYEGFTLFSQEELLTHYTCCREKRLSAG